jgi:hypothetical protein
MNRDKALALLGAAIAQTEPTDGANYGALKALADVIRRGGDIESAILATDRERRARRARAE